jgi:hypothetical protein
MVVDHFARQFGFDSDFHQPVCYRHTNMAMFRHVAVAIGTRALIFTRKAKYKVVNEDFFSAGPSRIAHNQLIS